MSITDNMTKEERKEYWELVMEKYVIYLCFAE